jgi:hypothetical protein
MRNATKILVKKSERKVSPDELGFRGSISWKMDYKATALEVVYWIHLAQDTNNMHPTVTKIMFG